MNFSKYLRYRVNDRQGFTLRIEFDMEGEKAIAAHAIYENSNNYRLPEKVKEQLERKVLKEYPNGFRA